ncbi:MAG: endonuclease/exonuclease/phosphatase family protein [Sumerlaeia bacterium]
MSRSAQKNRKETEHLASAEQSTDSPAINSEKPIPLWRMRVHACSILFTVFFLSLLILRLAFRDRWLGTEVLFWLPFWVFALPAALAILGLLGRRLKLTLIFATLLLSAVIFNQEQPLFFTPSSLVNTAKPANATTLLSWNVMMYNQGKRGVIEGYQEPDADINTLVEGTYQGDVPHFLKAELSADYRWVATRQMAVGSKYPVLDFQELTTRTPLRVFQSTLKTNQDEEFLLLLVDLPSPPRRTTAQCFLELEEVLLELQGKPTLVVGDFNTPRGSYWLNRVFRDYQDAYLHAEQRPSGWLASFPNYFPLVQIDHAFASPEITVHRAELLAGEASDHYRQYIVFSLSARSPE